jgi:hypothetical protein
MLRMERAAPLSFPIGRDGNFELPRLLPGSYEIDVTVFGHSAVRHAFEVAGTDLKLDLSTRKLF